MAGERTFWGNKTRAELEAEYRRIHHELAGYPVFLPGDDVRDKRGAPDRVYRIELCVADRDTEMLRLRDLATGDKQYIFAKDLVPHLEMVRAQGDTKRAALSKAAPAEQSDAGERK